MPRVHFPYGKSKLSVNIPDSRFKGCLISRLDSFAADKEPGELVQDAMRAPIGSKKLAELAVGKRNVVLIASDHTRPVPSKIIVPAMLREIRDGNPDAQITILVATGCHRGTTAEELVEKFGTEIVENENIVVHDCDDLRNMTFLGMLPSGGKLYVNRLAAEADLLVAEGFIEPHFFAGFSGGRKSVLPGIASRETVMFNHNGRFIADPFARTGIIVNNPIHKDMLFAARKAGLAYIVNVVLDSEKNVIFAAAGDAEMAHKAGTDFLSSMCRVTPDPADIVITSNGGYPLDQNIYQSVKGMTAAEATVREGGVIIMLSGCNDGHGGEIFYETFKNEKNLDRMMDSFVNTPPEKTIVDQWQSQIFARVLKKARVIFISDAPNDMVRDFHMIPAHSLEEALEIADGLLASEGITDGSILAVPDGVGVICSGEIYHGDSPRDEFAMGTVPDEKAIPDGKFAAGTVPDKVITRPLYEAVFDDPKSYVDFYYQEKCRDNVIFAKAESDPPTADSVIAMAHLNPYLLSVCGKPVRSYIIAAVATREDRRHEGHMRDLLEACFAFLKEHGVPFTYLLPVDENIYKPFGFEKICDFTPRRSRPFGEAEDAETSGITDGSEKNYISSDESEKSYISSGGSEKIDISSYDIFCIEDSAAAARHAKEPPPEPGHEDSGLPPHPVIMARVTSPEHFDQMAGQSFENDAARLSWLRAKRICICEEV